MLLEPARGHRGNSRKQASVESQRNVSDSQASLAAAVQQMAKDYVSLNVAIGGGYAPAGARPSAEAKIETVAVKK